MEGSVEKEKNAKKIIKTIGIVIAFCISFLVIKLGIDALIVKKEMKTAERAITVDDNVRMYPVTKEGNRYKTIGLGTNVYVLKRTTDSSGVEWCKVKADKSVGYVLSEDVGKYTKSYNKRDIMLDVSKFNLQNNFKNIGEFKAFVINNDIKFVYIRAGGRGYGEQGNFYTDPSADDYAQACEFMGVPFGYYFLEEATNSKEIDEEVCFINEYIRGHKYENNILPIALDVEKHEEKGRADEIWDTRYILVNELINKLDDGNKRIILYSNASIADKYLQEVNAKMWLAYYPDIKNIPDYWYSDITTEGAKNKTLIEKMVGWQFTESGVANLIDKKVDLSTVYSNYLLNNSVEDIENYIEEKKRKVFGPVLWLKDKGLHKEIMVND